jgi:ADP-ribose pyrophosphatase
MSNRIKKLETLAETRYLSLYDAEYANKKGSIKHWTIASRKDKNALNGRIFLGKEERVDAVVIAAIHIHSNKLVLVRQYRVPVNDYIYELPAGLIDGGEDVFTAVKRELMEETGLEIISIDQAKGTLPVYVSAGMTDESIALTYCLCQGEPSVKFLEEDEDLDVVMVSQEEAKELLNRNVKFDVKAYLTLQCFAALGRSIMK